MYELHHFKNYVGNPLNNQEKHNPMSMIAEQTVLWLQPQGFGTKEKILLVAVAAVER